MNKFPPHCFFDFFLFLVRLDDRLLLLRGRDVLVSSLTDWSEHLEEMHNNAANSPDENIGKALK